MDNPNLPPEPKRADYPDQETFEEALAGWNGRVRPILQAAASQRKRSKDSRNPPQFPASAK